MAIYLDISKVEQTSMKVSYEFATTDGRSGLLEIDLESGEVSLIRQLPGDDSNRLFFRAARKITVHWNTGELPEKTCWAS